MESLTLAILDDPFLVARAQALVPHARLRLLRDIEEFGQSLASNDEDAYVTTAERGSAWSLLYPHYAVVAPEDVRRRTPLAYAVASGDVNTVAFLNVWIEIQKENGTIQRLYDHWILGKDTRPLEPRWSIARNVLGWVE